MKEKKSFLVKVIPISKNATRGHLSYFSSIRLPKGTLVRVAVRKRFVTAVVIDCRDARGAKTEIRRAGFLLKKISQKDIFEATLSPEFLAAATSTSEYFAATTEAVLATLIPKLTLDNPVSFFSSSSKPRLKNNDSGFKETLLLQMESEERFGQYRALIRQAFARSGSVLFIVPTHLDLKHAEEELSRGIQEFVYVFASSMSKKKAVEIWGKAKTNNHAILFITTPAGLSFFRKDLDTVIVERENSRAYRTFARPYLNFKKFIEKYSSLAKFGLVLGDSVFSLETLWQEKEGYYGENSLIRWRLPGPPTKLVDAKSSQNERGRFEIFSPELKQLMEKAIAEKERIFLFGARKGLHPTTVCGDCGTVLECLNCKAPVVLHHRGNLRIYICHACGNRRDTEAFCSYCKSWKLVPLGIGTEEIARVARELFPNVSVNIIDKDYAPNDSKARAIIQKFDKEGGILVGTELAFFHLGHVPYTGLVSVDALFSIPDFGINERIFYLVSRLRELTTNQSVIQTRNVGRQTLAWASSGNIIDFYSNEIEERRTLLYPPFSLFIKITVPKKEVHTELERLKTLFAKWQPDVFKDSLIMRLDKNAWPDRELLDKLSLLPQEFSIKVDPESIL